MKRNLFREMLEGAWWGLFAAFAGMGFANFVIDVLRSLKGAS